jgi:hypothetical protein
MVKGRNGKFKKGNNATISSNGASNFKKPCLEMYSNHKVHLIRPWVSFLQLIYGAMITMLIIILFSLLKRIKSTFNIYRKSSTYFSLIF